MFKRIVLFLITNLAILFVLSSDPEKKTISNDQEKNKYELDSDGFHK